MIGGGALHSVNVARNIAFAAFNGLEGIISPTDCEVRQQTTSNSTVSVLPGTIAIANRATGVRDEMYVGRIITADTVAIASTGSSARSDLIVARVENPFEPGQSYAQPADPRTGPYIFSRVISNVGSSIKSAADLGLSSSMVALARIDIPANTSAITQAMITDLRQLSSNPFQRDFNLATPSTTQTLTATAYANWPSSGNLVTTIPAWATHVNMRAILSGVVYGQSGAASNVFGSIRVGFIGASSSGYSGPGAYNLSVPAGTDRAVLLAGATKVAVPAGNRGKPATIRVEGIRSSGSVGSISADGGTSISVEVEFIRLAESNS